MDFLRSREERGEARSVAWSQTLLLNWKTTGWPLSRKSLEGTKSSYMALKKAQYESDEPCRCSIRIFDSARLGVFPKSVDSVSHPPDPRYCSQVTAI